MGMTSFGLQQDVVAFCNSLTTDEVVCIMTLTSPEDWEGDDVRIISTLKSIIYCNMKCKPYCERNGHDLHCEGCNRNPHQ